MAWVWGVVGGGGRLGNGPVLDPDPGATTPSTGSGGGGTLRERGAGGIRHVCGTEALPVHARQKLIQGPSGVCV